MPQELSQRIIVGKLGKPFGIHGWLKLNSYTEPYDNLLVYRPWQICLNGVWKTVEITQTKINGQQLLVKLAECDTPEQAKLYTNCEIAVWREQLATLPKDDYYWTDLEGLTVINKQGKILGKVNHLLATGANDVLVIKGTKEYLIPYLPELFIDKVDLINQQIIVDWDEDY